MITSWMDVLTMVIGVLFLLAIAGLLLIGLGAVILAVSFVLVLLGSLFP